MVKINTNEEPNIVWSDDPNELSKKKKVKSSSPVIPSEMSLCIRPEKKGRGGKVVTVVYDFPVENSEYFKKLTKKLKRECGCGGTFKVESIEIQGDKRYQVKKYLENLGFLVKFTGG